MPPHSFATPESALTPGDLMYKYNSGDDVAKLMMQYSLISIKYITQSNFLLDFNCLYNQLYSLFLSTHCNALWGFPSQQSINAMIISDRKKEA